MCQVFAPFNIMIYNCAMNKYVYFAQRESDKLIKIGFSTHIPERMKYLRSKNGRMKLLGLIKSSTMKDETAVHRRFADCRVTGEWFTPSPDLMTFINEYAK